MKEERFKNFINAVIFVSEIFAGLQDRFLARKLYNKLADFVSAYVAQYKDGDMKVATDALLDILDYLEHSKTIAATPLLYARRNLFAFKLQLIRGEPKLQPVVKEKAPALKSKKEVHMTANKEKIFNYIRRSPNSRTKEIVYEFNILSERTVKRNLKELVSSGLIKKASRDNAVYYNIV